MAGTRSVRTVGEPTRGASDPFGNVIIYWLVSLISTGGSATENVRTCRDPRDPADDLLNMSTQCPWLPGMVRGRQSRDEVPRSDIFPAMRGPMLPARVGPRPDT